MANLKFGKEKRRVNYDLLQVILAWVLRIALVCAAAFFLVWYFGQQVSVIGDSMSPTLRNGNVVLTNRLVYDMSKPGRGDVVAFRPNGNPNAHCYIKRIIGLPGETVQIKKGKIYINGKELKEKYTTTEISDPGLAAEPIELGNSEFFVLGDDRTGSEDSRAAEIGNVKRKDIESKVWFDLTKGNRGFVR